MTRETRGGDRLRMQLALKVLTNSTNSIIHRKLAKGDTDGTKNNVITKRHLRSVKGRQGAAEMAGPGA